MYADSISSLLGDGGVYIGSGFLLLVLIIVVLFVLLRR